MNKEPRAAVFQKLNTPPIFAVFAVFFSYGYWATGMIGPALLIGVPALLSLIVALFASPKLRSAENPWNGKSLFLAFSASLAFWLAYSLLVAGFRAEPPRMGFESVLALLLFTAAPLTMFLFFRQALRWIAARSAPRYSRKA